MKHNRRNYYRILHVQPDAPAEIIKASYRTLMSKLRMHPDLGGDHDQALLVNEAYAVLGDPERRAAYDREAGIEPRLTRGRRRAAAAEAPPRRASRPEPADWATAAPDGEHCHWCHSPAPAVVEPDTRCSRCGAPLAPPPAADQQMHELVGRRSASRRPRGNLAIMQRLDGGATLSVRLRDLSVTGIGLVTTAAVPADTRVRIQSQDFEAIAVVVGHQRELGEYLLHARLLSIAPTRRTGVFVSETA
jgi:hypothetical protein